MAWYRLYFLGLTGDIRNADEFYTDNDDQALFIADGLNDAVSDLYAGWELWQDTRRVFRFASSAMPRPPLSQTAITLKMQADLLKREEILQASRTAFARSQRLLERMREVRQIVGQRDKRFLRNAKRPANQPG
jgi:hypothetical protein